MESHFMAYISFALKTDTSVKPGFYEVLSLTFMFP